MDQPKKILIVDDEKDIVDGLAAFLEDSGYKTIAAYDGAEGFKKVKSEHPHLITLDITMDKESGVRMYKNIHSDPETKNIPVIIITGISSEFKGFIEGRKQVPPPAGYFEKPIDREALLKKIKELIG